MWAVLTSACGGGGAKVQPLQWHACTGGQCATLTVPLDYSNPDGETIKLALFRIPAKNPKQRIGALLFNPGGPGSSGIAFLRVAAVLIPDQLAARFDLVTWDPRGTGASDPVKCGSTFDRVHDLPVALPTTAAELHALGAQILASDQSCARVAGPILGHVGTVNTARDLDRVRAALGEQRTSYVGYSYGTYLGQVYANMFPGRVRAMVLDGVVNANLTPRDNSLAQARSIEHSLDTFLNACSASPHCAFHSGGHAAAAFDALEARIHARPLRVGNRELGESQFWGGVLRPLYSDDTDALAASLASAASGDGRALLKAYDDLSDRNPNGTYGELDQANEAINCDDGLSQGAPAAYLTLEPEFRAVASRAGLFALYSTSACSYWPDKPDPPRGPFRAQGTPPILVIGTTGDPVTPYQNAVAVAHGLASGVLLTNVGATHTARGAAGGPCDDLVVPYLVRLAVPRGGTRCD